MSEKMDEMHFVPIVLVTGFDPFDGDAVNPSWEAARTIEEQGVAGVKIIAAKLPCTFAESITTLNKLMSRYRPHIVLALGLSGNRSTLSIEQVAINLINAVIPDNSGIQPLGLPVVAGGPVGYFTRLPVQAILAAAELHGKKMEVSYSAGTFVCNQVFYSMMHRLRRRRSVTAGFIHLPPLPQQAGRYSVEKTMPLGDQVDGIRLVISTIALTKTF